MSAPAPPALTVRTNGSKRTFAPGHDVVIGRDLRADVRIADKLVSRAHVLLRFEGGRWTAIDNGSLNGMFVDQRRVPTIDIRDGMSINISNPNGPRVTFEVGRVEGAVGRPPRTTVVPLQARPGAPQPPTNRSQAAAHPPSAPQPQQHGYPPSGPPGAAAQRDAAGIPAAVTARAAGLTTAGPAAQLPDGDADPAGATR